MTPNEAALVELAQEVMAERARQEERATRRERRCEEAIGKSAHRFQPGYYDCRNLAAILAANDRLLGRR